MIFSDKTLSQKLERTESRASADFVETRARLDPSSGATWIDVAGAYAMFDGPESPITQTFGLGLFDEITSDRLDQLEKFFQARAASVDHEVSPMADPSLIPLLNSRGYHPVEMTSVMYRDLNESHAPLWQSPKFDIQTRVIDESEAELWARTSASGWSTEMEGLAEFMLAFGRISARCTGAYPFLAELDRTPVATGMLFIYDDVCLLAGASTVTEGRNRGAQTALLAARLRLAYDRGCRLAMMGAAPGSQSQKNAEKSGFRIAYTRTKWHLAL
jgi:hypothetical protein